MALVMNHIVPLIPLEKAYKTTNILGVSITQYYNNNQ
jgi:hypothetical protein